jgi:hypothetical protein
MNLHRAGVLLAFVALVATLPLSSEEGSGRAAGNKERLAESLRVARANLNTPEGKRYDVKLASYTSEHDGPAMGACVEAAKKPDLSSFQLLLKLTADGHVRCAMVNPETNISICFRDQVKKESLPRPPRSDYWVLVEMSLSQ